MKINTNKIKRSLIIVLVFMVCVAIVQAAIIFTVDGDVKITGNLNAATITSNTVDTGQGANELYAMNQDIETTDAVTFDSINLGNDTLDVYESGTWIPTTSNYLGNITYSNCYYTRIGNLVFLHGNVVIGTTGDASIVQIRGFPYNVFNAAEEETGGYITKTNISISDVTLYTGASGDSFELRASDNSLISYNAVLGDFISFAITYPTTITT